MAYLIKEWWRETNKTLFFAIAPISSMPLQLQAHCHRSDPVHFKLFKFYKIESFFFFFLKEKGKQTKHLCNKKAIHMLHIIFIFSLRK